MTIPSVRSASDDLPAPEDPTAAAGLDAATARSSLRQLEEAIRERLDATRRSDERLAAARADAAALREKAHQAAADAAEALLRQRRAHATSRADEIEAAGRQHADAIRDAATQRLAADAAAVLDRVLPRSESSR